MCCNKIYAREQEDFKQTDHINIMIRISLAFLVASAMYLTIARVSSLEGATNGSSADDIGGCTIVWKGTTRRGTPKNLNISTFCSSLLYELLLFPVAVAQISLLYELLLFPVAVAQIS